MKFNLLFSRKNLLVLSFLFFALYCFSSGPLVASAEEYGNPLALFNSETNSWVPVTDFQTLIVAVLVVLQKIIAILALIFLVLGALIYITSAGNEKQITLAKSAMLAATIGLAIAIAAPLFLREIGTILGWVSPSDLPEFGTQLSLSQVLAKVLSTLLSFIGVVAIIALVIGGFLYLTSAGDADRADAGKGIVKYAVLGLVVALAGLVIITQVANFFV